MGTARLMKESVRKEVVELIKGYDIDPNMSAEYLRDNSPTGGSWPQWWREISKKIISEDFMKEFRDKICWLYISIFQKLNEDFMRELKDKVLWQDAYQHQEMSEDFIYEFRDYIGDKWLFTENEFHLRNRKNKITKQRMKEYEEKYKVHSRWELLDL